MLSSQKNDTQLKNPGGRPRVITAMQLERMLRAFSWGWPVSAACIFAKVQRRTFYDHEDKHPAFRSVRKALQDQPRRTALRNVCMAIESGDAATSRWYLERRVGGFSASEAVGDRNTQVADETLVLAALTRFVDLSRERGASISKSA